MSLVATAGDSDSPEQRKLGVQIDTLLWITKEMSKSFENIKDFESWTESEKISLFRKRNELMDRLLNLQKDLEKDSRR